MAATLDSGNGAGKGPGQPAAGARLAELLVSRLCHELAGPVGGVANGAEFLAEMGAEAGDDAAGLIGDSAARLSGALQFYRLAYGGAGHAVGEPDAVQEAAAGFLAGRGVDLQWRADTGALLDRPPAPKLVLLLIELACEALLRGGSLSLEGGKEGARVVAEGDRAALREDLAMALGAGRETGLLTPRTCHAGYAAQLAAGAGWRLTHDAGPDRVSLHLYWS